MEQSESQATDQNASKSFFSAEETFNVRKSFPSQAYQHSLNDNEFFMPQSKRLKLSSQPYPHESDGSDDDMVEVETESEIEEEMETKMEMETKTETETKKEMETEMETETDSETETDQKLINHTQVPIIIWIKVRLLFYLK